MLSPEHVNEEKTEDQKAPDSAEEKPVLPVDEKKRTWLEPLLRVVAIVLSAVGGFAAVYLVVLSYRPWLELGFENSSADQLAYLRGLAILLVFLVGLGCAVLFRSWWAMLFVPLAIGIGVVLTNYLSNQIAPDLLGYDDVGLGVFFYALIFVPISAVIGAFIGSYFGTVWKKAQQL